jgi:hypothetical protein
MMVVHRRRYGRPRGSGLSDATCVSSLWTLRRSCFEPDVAADISTAKRTVTRGGNKRALTRETRLENVAKALAEAMPVQTPGSGSDGATANRLQLPGDAVDPFARDLLSGRPNRKTGVVIAIAGEQAPGDPGIPVGERDGDNVGVSPLPHLA